MTAVELQSFRVWSRHTARRPCQRAALRPYSARTRVARLGGVVARAAQGLTTVIRRRRARGLLGAARRAPRPRSRCRRGAAARQRRLSPLWCRWSHARVRRRALDAARWQRSRCVPAPSVLCAAAAVRSLCHARPLARRAPPVAGPAPPRRLRALLRCAGIGAAQVHRHASRQHVGHASPRPRRPCTRAPERGVERVIPA